MISLERKGKSFIKSVFIRDNSRGTRNRALSFDILLLEKVVVKNTQRERKYKKWGSVTLWGSEVKLKQQLVNEPMLRVLFSHCLALCWLLVIKLRKYVQKYQLLGYNSHLAFSVHVFTLTEQKGGFWFFFYCLLKSSWDMAN